MQWNRWRRKSFFSSGKQTMCIAYTTIFIQKGHDIFVQNDSKRLFAILCNCFVFKTIVRKEKRKKCVIRLFCFQWHKRVQLLTWNVFAKIVTFLLYSAFLFVDARAIKTLVKDCWKSYLDRHIHFSIGVKRIKEQRSKILVTIKLSYKYHHFQTLTTLRQNGWSYCRSNSNFRPCRFRSRWHLLVLLTTKIFFVLAEI